MNETNKYTENFKKIIAQNNEYFRNKKEFKQSVYDNHIKDIDNYINSSDIDIIKSNIRSINSVIYNKNYNLLNVLLKNGFTFPMIYHEDINIWKLVLQYNIDIPKQIIRFIVSIAIDHKDINLINTLYTMFPYIFIIDEFQHEVGLGSRIYAIRDIYFLDDVIITCKLDPTQIFNIYTRYLIYFHFQQDLINLLQLYSFNDIIYRLLLIFALEEKNESATKLLITKVDQESINIIASSHPEIQNYLEFDMSPKPYLEWENEE